MATWWDVLLRSEYTEAIILFLSFFIGATIVDFILRRYGNKLAEKSDGDLIGKVFQIIHKPTYAALVLTGVFFAVKTFTIGDVLMKWINRAFFIIIAFLISLMIARTASVMISSWLRVSKRYEKTPEVINKVIAVIIYIIGALVVLDHFNIEISPIIATLGLGGLAVGLALQDTLKDFFAGLHIISDRPIRVGDFIELEGTTELKGYVEDIGWRSTRIRMLPNNYVIVPNSKLAASTIVNNNMPEKEMSLRVEVGVDYTSDLEKVEKVTCEVAREIQKSVEGAVKDFEPFIRLHTFGESNINFTVILRIKEYVDKFLVRNEFFKALHRRYKKEGIEISWPIRKLYDMNEAEVRKKAAEKGRKKSSKAEKKKSREKEQLEEDAKKADEFEEERDKE